MSAKSFEIPEEVFLDMQKKMAMVNLMCALEEKDPFFYEVEFKKEDVKFPEVSERKDFIEKVWKEYLKLNNPISSINLQYQNYGQLILNKLEQGCVKIPNGCCTQKKCYINQFYDEVIKMLRKS